MKKILITLICIAASVSLFLGGLFSAAQAPGLRGPQGIQGRDGADGLDGLNGADGMDGAQGERGPQGGRGADGLDATSAVTYEYMFFPFEHPQTGNGYFLDTALPQSGRIEFFVHNDRCPAVEILSNFGIYERLYPPAKVELYVDGGGMHGVIYSETGVSVFANHDVYAQPLVFVYNDSDIAVALWYTVTEYAESLW